MTKEQMFAEALILATKKHQGQVRKDGTPYIYHPLTVAFLAQKAGFPIEYQITGLFHDLLEDSDTSENDISEYGEDILKAVKLLTYTHDIDKSVYVEKILENKMAATIKSLDIICNMVDTGFCPDRLWAKMYVKKAMTFYLKKFSRSVDEAIYAAEIATRQLLPKKPVPISYDISKLELYMEMEANHYAMLKESYNPDIKPDMTRTDLQVVYDTFQKCSICIYAPSYNEISKPNQYYVLGKGGWRIYKGNPFEQSEYGEELRVESKEKLAERIKTLVESGWFYDFVTTDHIGI